MQHSICIIAYININKYSETSQTRPLIKPTIPEYWPIFEIYTKHLFAKEVSQNQPPLYTAAIFIGPRAGIEKFHCTFKIKWKVN
jgi:hypothetical protein